MAVFACYVCNLLVHDYFLKATNIFSEVQNLTVGQAVTAPVLMVTKTKQIHFLTDKIITNNICKLHSFIAITVSAMIF